MNDLLAFLAVARVQSFTRAAAELGISQPALSAKITALEARLGVRLLTRTTRSVSTTEAGEQLVQTIGPHVDSIEAGLAALSEIRDKPAGSRIRHAPCHQRPPCEGALCYFGTDRYFPLFDRLQRLARPNGLNSRCMRTATVSLGGISAAKSRTVGLN